MKKSSTVLGAFAIAASFCLTLAPMPASGAAVNLELALVVDESGSVDATEWALQRNGYVQAFQDATVQAAIIAAGGIAVTYIQFDDGLQQGIGWTLINSVASANNFATAIQNLARFGVSGTFVQNAIDFAYRQFGTEVGLADNGFTSLHQVIDVSGDGRDNEPGNANNATDLTSSSAIAAGIDRINGVVISPAGEAGLLAFYQTQVQDGVNGFTVVANQFSDFAPTIKDKIIAEIRNTPEGGTTIVYSLLSVVALGLFAVRRKTALA